jgi:uncharacterized protein (TIGR03437 family)
MRFNFAGKTSVALFLSLSSLLSAASQLSLSTTAIGPVIIVPGSNGPTQNVQAMNLGSGTLNLTVTSSASWLSATLGADVTVGPPGSTSYSISIALNTSGLAPGIYTEYVTVADPNAVDSPQQIAVTVNTLGVPSSLNVYVAPYGSGNASQSVVPIYTAGTGVFGKVTTQSGGSWLAFESGNLGVAQLPYPWFIQATAIPSLLPGTYTGAVTISGSSASSDNKTINVTLNVTSAPIIDLSKSLAVQISGYQNGPQETAYPVLNNVGMGSLAISGATATASPNFLSTSVLNANTLQITADPTGLSAGTYTGTVTITSNAANNPQVSIPVEFYVAPAGSPQISYNGIVNIATFTQQEAAAQGDIFAIFGSQFAASGTAAQNASTPLATTLGNTQVLVNNVPAPLYYVSPGQINFQLPYSLTPGQAATVQAVSGSRPGNVRPLSIAAIVPRLLPFLPLPNYGLIVNFRDGSFPFPTGSVAGLQTHPAKPGDTLIMYGVGFGQTNPAAIEGMAASSSPLQQIQKLTATFGSSFQGIANGVVGFAGLTPTAVGLYQINVTLPANVPLGAAIPVYVVVNGVQSQTVTLAISATGN